MGIRTEQDCLNEISRISQAANDIKGAIEEKGVSVPEGTPLSDYDDLIRNIPAGISYPEGLSGVGININTEAEGFSYEALNQYLQDHPEIRYVGNDGIITDSITFSTDSEIDSSCVWLVNSTTNTDGTGKSIKFGSIAWGNYFGKSDFEYLTETVNNLKAVGWEILTWDKYGFILPEEEPGYVDLLEWLVAADWVETDTYFNSMSLDSDAYKTYLPEGEGEDYPGMFRVMFKNGLTYNELPEGSFRVVFPPTKFEVFDRAGNQILYVDYFEAAESGSETDIELYSILNSHLNTSTSGSNTFFDAEGQSNGYIPANLDNKYYDVSIHWEGSLDVLLNEIKNITGIPGDSPIGKINAWMSAVILGEGEEEIVIYHELLFEEELKLLEEEVNIFKSENSLGEDNHFNVKESDSLNFVANVQPNPAGPVEFPEGSFGFKPIYPRNFTISGNGGSYSKLISLEDAISGSDDDRRLYSELISHFNVITIEANLIGSDDWYSIPSDEWHYISKISINNLGGLREYLGLNTIEEIVCNFSGVVVNEEGTPIYTETLFEPIHINPIREQ